MTDLQTHSVTSPIGRLVVVSRGGRVCALDYADCAERMRRLLRGRYGTFQLRGGAPQPAGDMLTTYFEGEFDAFDELDIDLGGTPFQQKVWNALRTIPAGTTRSYAGLARQLGVPAAYRAVGLANARNPIAIVVPCHRLIGADGGLTGYAGGLERKRWLLRHEGCSIG